MDSSLLFSQLDPAAQAQVGLTMPDAFFVTGGDGLQISSWNALAGVTLTIAGRFRNLDGQDRPFVYTHTPATNRTQTSSVFSLGDGWLLNVTVFASAAAPITGQTFVRLQLVHGLTGSGIVLGTLASGYVTAVQPVAWPGSAIANALDGGGALRSIAGATPAAGAEISETVPTGARWELLSFRAQLVSSATVASRIPILLLDDGTTVYFHSSDAQALAASQTWLKCWAEGTAFITGEPSQGTLAPFPVNIRLGAGHRIRTSTVALQATDQWSAVQYLVREWLEAS